MRHVIIDFDVLTLKKKNHWKMLMSANGEDTLSVFKQFDKSYKNGKISYKEWCDFVFMNFDKEHINEQYLKAIAAQIALLEGSEEFFETLTQNGVKLTIISKGIKNIVEFVLAEKIKDIDQIVATKLFADHNNNFDFALKRELDIKSLNKLVETIKKESMLNEREVIFFTNDDKEFLSITGCNIYGVNLKQNSDTKLLKNLKISNLQELLPYIGVTGPTGQNFKT